MILPGKIEFRAIHASDEGFLLGLYASSREWEFQHTLWEEAKKQAFLNSQYQLQDRHYKQVYLGAIYEIIQLDGVDIGRLSVQRRADEIRIMDLILLPAYQGRGIGQSILQNLVHEAQGGKVPVTLHVEQGNPAMQLYLRLGFRQTGVSGQHIAMAWQPDLTPREI